MEPPIPSLDTWTSIFLLAAGQGLFLAVLIVQRNREQHRGNIWLAAFILSFSLLLVFNVSFWTHYHLHFPPVNLLYPSLAYLVGPFLLFYLDGLAEAPVFNRFRGIHFLPAFLVFALRIPAYWQPLSTLQQKALEGNQYLEAPLYAWGLEWLAGPVFITSYLLLYAGLVYWYGERILYQQDNSRNKRSRLRARINLIRSLFAGYTLAFVSYYILVRMAFFRIEHDYLISLVMATAIYWIGYREYLIPGPAAAGTQAEPSAGKYRSSSLTSNAVSSIAVKLETYMREQQPYHNNELRLNDLADTLEISPHQLSQVINEHYEKSFNQFINEYRVEEAKSLLASAAHRQTFIIEIAYQVGFNNKTTFNHAFKSQTGMSPSKWRNRHLVM